MSAPRLTIYLISLWSVAASVSAPALELTHVRHESTAGGIGSFDEGWSPSGTAFCYGLNAYPRGTYVFRNNGTDQYIAHPDDRVAHLDSMPSFSPNGEWIAAILDDHSIHVVNLTTPGPGAVLKGHTDLPATTHWSPDNRTLYSIGYDDRLREWDVATGREIRSVPFRAVSIAGHLGAGYFWSPDGRYVGFGGWDGRVHFLNRRNGMESFIDSGFYEPISVHWSPNGRLVATNRGGFEKPRGGTAWDTLTGQRVFRTPPGEEILEWSPDGSKLITMIESDVQGENVLRIRNGADFRTLLEVPHFPHTYVQWHPSGNFVWAIKTGLEMWEVQTGAQVMRPNQFPEMIRFSRWSPDGIGFLTAGPQQLDIWTLR